MSLRWKYETYRKLYVREEGTFAQLPLLARALAAELLKICDCEGRIHLRGKSPADAILFALGGTRADRRVVPGLVPCLLEDGYLVRDGEDLVIRNFDECKPSGRQ